VKAHLAKQFEYVSGALGQSNQPAEGDSASNTNAHVLYNGNGMARLDPDFAW
jgi:hypothetical protein